MMGRDFTFQMPQPDVAGRPVSLAPRPVILAGREDVLADLHTRLTGGDGPRIVALHGLGGAGKTTVAVEYAHRHQATTGVVWQFPAEDPAVLTAEFGRLAALLGASGGVLDPRDPVASVHAVLAASHAPYLLVFDNVPDQESVRAFLPPAGNGRVLLTSQSALWPPGQALEVPVLDNDIAAGFLTARTGDPDAQTARDLAGELGGLPLALEQAAAYIQASGGSLAGYLDLFRQRRADLLAKPTGHGQMVATTWALAFSQLEQEAPRAAGLQRLLACFAPEPIPLPVVLHPNDGLSAELGPDVAPLLVPLLSDPLAVGDAVAALRRFSLVIPAGDGSVLVHRLVQAVTVDQMPGNLATQWRQAATALIRAAIPADTDPPETWPVCAALLPHAGAVLAEDSDEMTRIANYHGARGSYAAARNLQLRIVDARERVLGPEHPDTLTARHDLARWTGRAGDAAGARDQYAELLPLLRRVLGPEHPDTLTARHDLARWTGRAGDAARARDQYAELRALVEQALGPEHPLTQFTQHSLARWIGIAGDAGKARDLFAALLPVRERILGPEHPHTLGTRHSLARWTGEAGDAAEARDQYAALLPVRERILGPEHPNTLTTRARLARFTGEAGNAALARDQYTALVPVYERIFGPDHPETLAARANLAQWTGEADDPAAAREQYGALLPIRERVLGHEHPVTSTTRAGLDLWTKQAKSTD